MKIKLNPKDVRTKEFNKKLFGYDPDEVDAFLIEVSNELQNLINALEKFKKSPEEKKIESVVEEAKKRIEQVIQQSKKEKEELEKEKKKIENEIERLKLLQKKMADKLKVSMIEITKIFEELKRDAESREPKENSKTGDKSNPEIINKQD